MPAYAAAREALVVVEGADAAVRLGDRRPECVAAAPGADRAFVGTFDAGLYRTTDAGDSFEPVGDGVGPDAVTAVAVSPHDPDEVWVGTEPSRVYRSTDAGDSFERVGGLTGVPSAGDWSFPPRPDTHHVRWLEPDPAERDRWYVGIEAGALVVTPDAGDTWIDRPPGSRRDNHTLATHPDAPGRVYAAAGDGYAESRDGGESWERPTDGLEHRYCWGLAVDPGDPGTVLTWAATGAAAAHRRGESYLYRRRGGRWERLDDADVPTGEGVHRAVLAAGREPGAVWAFGDDGLYRSGDAGDSFERVVATPDAAGAGGAVARGLAVA